MIAQRLTSGLFFLLATGVFALEDVPQPGLFLRRSLARATVIDNYVYIEGGELSQDALTEPDLSITKWRKPHQVNSTISIDLSTSWTAASVSMKATKKPDDVPRKGRAQIWTDLSEKAFYLWGGAKPAGFIERDPKTVWKFTTDGNGGGKWSKEVANNEIVFQSLRMGDRGAYANTNTTGFVLGGHVHRDTEVGQTGVTIIHGMAAFNMKTKTYEAISSPLGNDAFTAGIMQCVPQFGVDGKGLMVVLGGMLSATGSNDVKEMTALGFDRVVMFDPETKKSWEQKATGEIPPTPRSYFCHAGFKNKDGGFDIFISGGENVQRGQSRYSDAYILSLPGFFWKKVPDMPTGSRANAACVPVKNKQVLSIGGIGSGGDWDSKDANPQGLMLFDMTALKWKYEYDALDDAPYESADSIKEWYKNGSLANVQWSSSEVQKMFATSSDSPTPSGDTTADISPSGSSTPGSGENGGSSTPIGAIVGGVVGGIAVLALIVGMVWFLLRKKRQSQAEKGGSTPVLPMEPERLEREMEGDHKYPPPPASELAAKYKYVPGTATEIGDSGHGYAELPEYYAGYQQHVQPVELDAGHHRR